MFQLFIAVRSIFCFGTYYRSLTSHGTDEILLYIPKIIWKLTDFSFQHFTGELTSVNADIRSIVLFSLIPLIGLIVERDYNS